MNHTFCGLAHLGIFTDNLQETLNFYVKHLSFSPVYQTVIQKPQDRRGMFPMKFAMIRLNELYIEIMECANKANTGNGINDVVNHIGIRVSNLEDAISHLLETGLDARRVGPITEERDQIPGRSFRQCRVTGWNGETIGLYEIDNNVFYKNLPVCYHSNHKCEQNSL